MKRGTRHGEYLRLHWEYGDPDEVYVYGHLTPEEFAAAVDAYIGGTVDTDDFGSFPRFEGASRHCWARFCFDGCDYDGNPRRTLREYTSPAPGRFRVTAATPARWEHYKRCDGYAGEEPCWIRAGHGGPHMPHATLRLVTS